jgi:hypothetical protein
MKVNGKREIIKGRNREMEYWSDGVMGDSEFPTLQYSILRL